MGKRSYPDQPRIYIDQDGVLADFERCMVENGKTAKEIKCLRGTYLGLHPYPGAIEGVRALKNQGWQLFVLSKPPGENPFSATEKIQWLNQHLPEIGENVIITPDKGCVGCERDYLIDDHAEWANAHSFRGTIVHFGPGREHVDWAAVVSYFSRLVPTGQPKLDPARCSMPTGDVTRTVDVVETIELAAKGGRVGTEMSPVGRMKRDSGFYYCGEV